ncbi:MAG: hypothetical protein AB1Z98_13750 [Nannocystaceae bacterium]
MKRFVTVCMLVSGGCGQPEPPRTVSEPPPSATSPKPRAVPAAESEPAPNSSPTPVAEPAPPSASLCQAMCMHRNQARAVAIETIERDCQRECDAVAERVVDPQCEQAARAARARVEKGSMRTRAPRVWAELAKPELHCGGFDPFIAALADAAVPRVERDAALLQALRADPFADYLCPALPRVLDQTPSVSELVTACEIDGMDPSGTINDDLSPMTVLARHAIVLRWQAAGLYDGDRRTLLSILLLASALERDAERP